MRIKILTKLLPGLFFFILTSCQKEISFDSPINGGTGSGSGSGSGNTNNIIGDYDFVGMVAHTISTVTATQAGQELKAVTVSDYASKNNSGTIKITSTQMISTSVAYTIDTIMNAKTYVNGVLLDDQDFPFQVNSPATSSTSSYVRNSADSITMTGAVGLPDPSGNTPTGPIGAKLSWHGDTLFMHVHTTINQTITQGGVPATLVGTVDGISKLKKR